MQSIVDLFNPLVGQLTWRVKRGHGSFMTMEFGHPHLEVRNPITPKHTTSESGKRRLLQRLVFPKGQWHLFIQHTLWNVSAFGQSCHCNDERDHVDSVLALLDGQKLTSIDWQDSIKQLTLRFDLVGMLSMDLLPSHLEGPGFSLNNCDTGIITTYKEDGTLFASPSKVCKSGEICAWKLP